MFRFEQIEGMYLLILIPIILVIIFFSLRMKENQIKRLGTKSIVSRMMPFWSVAREWTKSILFALGLGLCFIAWSNPQWGTRSKKVKAKSSDVILALDISHSMMAEDISPNRLERAKRMASDLVNELKGNRIGLIFFAGSAYLQMPLTNDVAAADLFLRTANTNQAGTQGTAIADAIDLGLSAFSSEGNNQKAMIIISDGENHDEAAIKAAEKAKDEGTYIYTIGVGTGDGGIIPIRVNDRIQYKTDNSGARVLSKLNIGLMQDLASAGGGEAYLLNQGSELIADLKKQIEKIEKEEVEQRSFTEFNSYFQYFIALGIILLLIEFLLPKGKNNKLQKKSILEI